jgi:hypothetical protein
MGTVTVTEVALVEIMDADVPLNLTAEASARFVPLMTTVTVAADASAPPEVGVKEVIVGA